MNANEVVAELGKFANAQTKKMWMTKTVRKSFTCATDLLR